MTKSKGVPGGRTIRLSLQQYREIILYLKKDENYMKNNYIKLTKHEKDTLLYREKLLHVSGVGDAPWPMGEHLIYGRLDKNGNILSPTVLIPIELSKDIIKKVHEDIQHGGRTKTYNRVRLIIIKS